MLPYVAAALRASPSESTGYSANLLMLGREVNTPSDIVYGVIEPQGDVSYDDFVESVRDRMRESYDSQERTCRWPQTEISGITTSGSNRDHLRWVTLCTTITLGVSRGAPISGLESTRARLW